MHKVLNHNSKICLDYLKKLNMVSCQCNIWQIEKILFIAREKRGEWVFAVQFLKDVMHGYCSCMWIYFQMREKSFAKWHRSMQVKRSFYDRNSFRVEEENRSLDVFYWCVCFDILLARSRASVILQNHLRVYVRVISNYEVRRDEKYI